MTNTNKKEVTIKNYTYLKMADDLTDVLKDYCENNPDLTTEDYKVTFEKLEQFRQSLINKQEYSKAHPSKSKSKTSEKTITEATQLLTVLDSEPKTVKEINALLGTSFTPLNIANLIRHIAKTKEVIKSKKKVITVSSKGLKAEVLHTAYAIA